MDRNAISSQISGISQNLRLTQLNQGFCLGMPVESTSNCVHIYEASGQYTNNIIGKCIHDLPDYNNKNWYRVSPIYSANDIRLLIACAQNIDIDICGICAAMMYGTRES